MKNEQAYELGKQAAQNGYKTMKSSALYQSEYGDAVMGMNNTQLVFFEAGLIGAQMPYKVTGWRYGHVPACGRSYNGRENCLEAGVSLMAVDGGAETVDKVSALFISTGRSVVRVEGYLHTYKTGGDGEPLVIEAREI